MPNHWQLTTLGEATEVEMGQSPPGDTYNSDGDGLPFLQGSAEFGERVPSPNRWCSAPTRVAEPGDLLVSVRAPVGDTNFADARFAIGRGLARVRSTSVATSDFLRLVIQAEVGRLNQNAGGGMFASITAKNLRGFRVAIPPVTEQRRIVDLIESIDSYIDSLRTQIEVTRAARSALLAELLAKPGDDWQESTLGDAAVVEMGQSPPGDTYNSNGDGLPFLQGSAEFGDRFPSPDRWCSAPTRVAEPGDLLVSVRAPVGDTNFADTRLAIGRGLARVRSSSVASAEFLRLVIQVEVGRLNQVAGGGMFASITAKNLRGLSVALPPIQEQRRIVDLIGSIDEQVALLVTQANSAQLFRGSAMSELLSGERLLDESYDMAVSP